jgi:hypothetical protein
MSSKPSSNPKTPAATLLSADVHQRLRGLAEDLGTSVAGLLRLGAMKVLEDCEGELPASVAHRRRISFGGEVPQYADKVDPEVIPVPLADPVYAALRDLADERGLNVASLARDLVRDGIRRAEVSRTSGLN